MNHAVKKTSMRHLYLYAYFLLEEVKRQGRPIRIEWANIRTADIGPDPKNPAGLLLQISHMAATGTEEDAKLLRALISHEVVCHGNNTDFSVSKGPGLEGMLTGILEDPRGELLGAKTYPGSKRVIREGIEILTQRGLFTGPDKDQPMHPAAILTGWLLTELRSELLGQKCLEEFSFEFRKLAIETFGTKLTSAIKVEALKAAHGHDTQSVKDSAQCIVDLINERKEEEEKKEQADDSPDPDNGDADSDPADQQGGGAGDPDDNGQQGGDQSSTANQPGGDSAGDPSSGGDPTGGAGQSVPGEPGFEPDGESLKEALSNLLTAEEGDAGSYGKGLEDVLCEANEAILGEDADTGNSHTNDAEISERAAVNSASQQRRAQLRSDARTTTAALMLRLEELLESFSLVDRRLSTEGRLRANRVWKSGLGDLQIFQKKSRTEELDTCAYMLVDESYSMKENFSGMMRAEAAGRVAVAAGEALDSAEVPFGLATFSTHVREWKSFDDNWSEALTKYQPSCVSSTNTHLAVPWALKKFVGRKEKRKILIVVLDGDPGKFDELQAALHEASFFDVEVRFVLIGEEELHRYQGLSAPYGVARTPNELAEAVFGALEAIIA